MDRKQHWEDVYDRKAATQVSWYQAEATLSLHLINEAASGRAVSIVDVGGGASTLVDRLVDRPNTRTTVLDLSGLALRQAQARLGEQASRANWVEADILTADLGDAAYDIWHDRAVFHFLTDSADRRLYVEQVRRTVRPGGRVLIATFALDGPEKCSGLEVVRYSPDVLHSEFGNAFELIESVQETHVTPWGSPQNFVYCVCAVRGATPSRSAA